jgi:hypothetical protein
MNSVRTSFPKHSTKLGALGWELVFSGDGMIFKRPLGEH